jgi:hypothetical protein
MRELGQEEFVHCAGFRPVREDLVALDVDHRGDLLDPQSDLIWFAELVVDLREGTPNEGPLIRLREIRC